MKTGAARLSAVREVGAAGLDAPGSCLAGRLRLTLGLRKESGRWFVAHEHHSFPLDTDGEVER